MRPGRGSRNAWRDRRRLRSAAAGPGFAARAEDQRHRGQREARPPGAHDGAAVGRDHRSAGADRDVRPHPAGAAAMTYPLRLQGATVTLRDFDHQDVDAVLAIVGDGRVTRWLSFDDRDRGGAERMLTAAINAAQAAPRMEY